MQILDKTESICPVCFYEGKLKKIDANIIEDDEKIFLKTIIPNSKATKRYLGEKND